MKFITVLQLILLGLIFGAVRSEESEAIEVEENEDDQQRNLSILYPTIKGIKSRRDTGVWCGDEVGKVKCDRVRAQSWEKYQFYHEQSGYYFIRGGNQNKYCHGTDYNFKCDSNNLNDFARWSIETHGDWKAFKNKATRRYVVAEEKRRDVLWWSEHDYYYLKADRTWVREWEGFQIIDL